MTVFFYHYMDPRGRTRLYWQQAESAADCCALLADCGIYPIHLIGLQWPAFLAARGLSARQLAAFLRQLSMALAGGVQLLEALHEMGREQSRERYRAFFARLSWCARRAAAF